MGIAYPQYDLPILCSLNGFQQILPYHHHHQESKVEPAGIYNCKVEPAGIYGGCVR